MHLVADQAQGLVADGAIVHAIHLKQPVAVGGEALLVGRRARTIDDGSARDSGLRELVQHEVLERVVAQHRRERYLGAGPLEMAGHDGGASTEPLGPLQLDAEGRVLGCLAQQRTFAVPVHDRVAHDMDADAAQPVEHLAKSSEVHALGVHQAQKLVHRDSGGLQLEELGGRVDDVARREHDLSAITLQGADFLLGPGRNALGEIFVSLGEVIGLQAPDVLDRRRIGVDDDVIDCLECRQILGS